MTTHEACDGINLCSALQAAGLPVQPRVPFPPVHEVGFGVIQVEPLGKEPPLAVVTDQSIEVGAAVLPVVDPRDDDFLAVPVGGFPDVVEHDCVGLDFLASTDVGWG